MRKELPGNLMVIVHVEAFLEAMNDMDSKESNFVRMA